MLQKHDHVAQVAAALLAVQNIAFESVYWGLQRLGGLVVDIGKSREHIGKYREM